jgi:putative transposase
MDEKLKFIARLLEGEKMAPLCREFGISRKTGHKLWGRYREMGNEALIAQKRTPYRYANKLPLQMEALILDIKKEFSNWGAPKIREKICRRFPDIKLPAISTIHAVLDRNGLVESKLRRKNHTSIQPMRGAALFTDKPLLSLKALIALTSGVITLYDDLGAIKHPFGCSARLNSWLDKWLKIHFKIFEPPTR